MINIDISTSQGVSYAGGTFSPTVTYENTTYGGVVPPVCPDWITFEYIGGAQEGDNYVESYRLPRTPSTLTTPERTHPIIRPCPIMHPLHRIGKVDKDLFLTVF